MKINNWKIILSNLTDGPVSSKNLRKSVFDTRQPGKEMPRGQYTWYFSWAYRWSSQPMGLDYGYIRRVDDCPGMYEMTDLGRQYLNSVKKPYRSSSRRPSPR